MFSVLKRKSVKFLLPFIAFIVLLLVYPLPGKLEPSWSRQILYSDGEVMRTTLSQDEKWRVFLPLKEIDPLLIKTTLCYEDRFFYYHPGINPFSVVRAIFQNLKAGKIVSGASTITMQLARIVEPKKRTILSKLVEGFRALQFELRLGKDRVLEMYLNLAPYGGNIEGVGAASLAYFGKLPHKLAPEQVAFLVSLPRNPLIFKDMKKLREGRDRVLECMFKRGIIDEKEYKRAVATSLPAGRKPFPFEAPHASDFLLSKYPGEREIKSTIKRYLQKRVESILSSYRKSIFSSGATNASVVVIENETGRVRALVGSLDYWDRSIDGQVRGFYAFRSPGSALKPFLYALAIEEGVINPEMLIEDAPYRFSNFSPINFSGKWSGLVKAEDALAYSLNIPFVLILRRTGYRKFIDRLASGGLVGPFSPEDYGLTVITGGMDVRLLELTNLYSALARGGVYMDYTLVEGTRRDKRKIFRPGAVLLTLRALGKRNRPDAPDLASFTMPRTVVYWKTGTSWGRRDAWSIGFVRKYTVGVWVGNFNGEGAEGIVGAKIASPIMFDILRSIENEVWDGKFSWERRALKELEYVRVCRFSGYKPSEGCSHTKLVQVLKDAHPHVECPFHRKFILERKTGYRACPWKQYRAGELVEKALLIFPPPVQRITGKGRPPSYAPDCKISEDSHSLVVVSPVNGGTYMPVEGVKNARYVPLLAFSSYGKIHWFLNGKFIGTTVSGETLKITPPEGENTVVVQDAAGVTKKIKFHVIIVK